MAQDPRDTGIPRERVPKGHCVQGLQGEYIEAALRNLKGHEGSLSTVFCKSKRSFKLVRKGKLKKEFVVKGLTKKQKLFEAYKGASSHTCPATIMRTSTRAS